MFGLLLTAASATVVLLLRCLTTSAVRLVPVERLDERLVVPTCTRIIAGLVTKTNDNETTKTFLICGMCRVVASHTLWKRPTHQKTVHAPVTEHWPIWRFRMFHHLGIRVRTEFVIATASFSTHCLLLLSACAGTPRAENPVVGHPRSAELVSIAQEEMKAGFRRRGAEGKLDRYHNYIDRLMDNSTGDKKWSDKTGNCRLSWLNYLVRRPLAATAEAELFTRRLHEAALKDHGGLDEILALAAQGLDLSEAPDPRPHSPGPRGGTLGLVERYVAIANRAFQKALAALDETQIELLKQHLYAVTTRDIKAASTFADAELGRQVTDALEGIDRQALLESARALVPLADPKFLRRLAAMKDPNGNGTPISGLAGPGGRFVRSPGATILIAGRESHEYDLDEMGDVDVVIDLGGDDIYREGTVSPERRVLVLIDLGGNDRYTGAKAGVQGSAVLGVSALIDAFGNDTYEAGDISQGSCLAGSGILIDLAGNDSYKGLRRTQGHAICGVGILIDRAGTDRYRGALLAQGVGGPLGFGLLDDLSGNDHFYAGGLYPNVYGDTPGYSGWSQGMGVGPRGVANGGLGVLLDGSGDDVYECDYFSHGGGYWFAAGFARDFGGNDRRIASTQTAFEGGPRKEKPFLRWGFAFGCHFAAGFLFDDDGDDTYGGYASSGTGFAWDFGVTALCDFAGNDSYTVGQGYSAQAGLALFFDTAGNDQHGSDTIGRSDPVLTYHKPLKNVGNLAFAIDYGGHDRYAKENIADNTYSHIGTDTGFVIDRPAVPTRAELRKKPPQATAGEVTSAP